jgi:hypothetical protein
MVVCWVEETYSDCRGVRRRGGLSHDQAELAVEADRIAVAIVGDDHHSIITGRKLVLVDGACRELIAVVRLKWRFCTFIFVSLFVVENIIRHAALTAWLRQRSIDIWDCITDPRTTIQM